VLSPEVREILRHGDQRVVITGAGGWIGRATLALLADALGSDVHRRVVCFGSAARQLKLGIGLTFDQRPLTELPSLDWHETVLLHLAFLTKDKVAGMPAGEYRRANLALSATVMSALEGIGANRVFLASSGAAGFADDENAASDLRFYGQLKRDDEDRFATWANESSDRRLVIGRIFNISGPHINKHQHYALASLILDALAGRELTIKAPHAVVRGHVAIRELMSLVFALLLHKTSDAVTRFESGGEPMELGEVATVVAEELGTSVAARGPLLREGANVYVGDHEAYSDLLARHGVEPVSFRTQVVETASYLKVKAKA
jgi:nucleoside-diphosphate-sugar epimerase